MHGSVIYDKEENIFKMWYLGDAGDSREYFEKRYFICYAISSDGIRWEKPSGRYAALRATVSRTTPS